jgi:hypothetical protein
MSNRKDRTDRVLTDIFAGLVVAAVLVGVLAQLH